MKPPGFPTKRDLHMVLERFSNLHNFGWELVPPIFFTAILWSNAQRIADTAAAAYLPGLAGAPLWICEGLVAIIGLYLWQSKKRALEQIAEDEPPGNNPGLDGPKEKPT